MGFHQWARHAFIVGDHGSQMKGICHVHEISDEEAFVPAIQAMIQLSLDFLR
jgi:hypothetical protein